MGEFRSAMMKRFHACRPSTRSLLVGALAAAFLLQGFLPGLDLAFRGEMPRTLFGVESAICHSSPSGDAVRTAAPTGSGGEGQSEHHGCCLVCQATPLAKGALPSPTFTVPTAGTAKLLVARSTLAQVDQRASRQHLARAPPIAVA